jgi:hypothetical protein
MMADMKLPPIEVVRARVRAPSRPSSTPLAQPAGRWARSSTTHCRAPWFSALSSLSAGNAGAASGVVYFHGTAGCWVTSNPMIRSAATCASVPGSSVSGIVMRPNIAPDRGRRRLCGDAVDRGARGGAGGMPGPVLVAGWSAGGASQPSLASWR